MRTLLANGVLPWGLATLAVGLLAYRLFFTANPVQSEGAVPGTARAFEIGGLAISAEALRFGEVWEKKDFTWVLPIHNTTRQPIEVVDWQTSCNCLDVQPKSLRIGAQQTATARLRLDLTTRRPHEANLARRHLIYEIMPVLAGGKGMRAAAWKVEGEVRRKVTLDALYVHFGESPVRGEALVSRKLMGAVHVPFQRIETVAAPKYLDVRLRSMPGNSGRFELLVSPQPALPVGPFQSDVVLNLITKEGKRERGLVLPVEGVMRPEIQVLPSRLFLPSAPVGSKTTATLVLRATPASQLMVDHVEVDSADVTVESVSVEGISPGRAFRVTQHVKHLGNRSSVVRFVMRRPDAGLTTVQVEVFCSGVRELSDVPLTPEGKLQ